LFSSFLAFSDSFFPILKSINALSVLFNDRVPSAEDGHDRHHGADKQGRVVFKPIFPCSEAIPIQVSLSVCRRHQVLGRCAGVCLCPLVQGIQCSNRGCGFFIPNRVHLSEVACIETFEPLPCCTYSAHCSVGARHVLRAVIFLQPLFMGFGSSVLLYLLSAFHKAPANRLIKISHSQFQVSSGYTVLRLVEVV